MRDTSTAYRYRSDDNYVYGREARLRRIRLQRRRAEQRRRRVMILCAVVTVMLLSTSLTGFSRIQTRKGASNKYYTAVTVQCNDTLWSIAHEYRGEEYSSDQEYMREIKEINGMKSDAVYYGQKLVLPYYSPVEK